MNKRKTAPANPLRRAWNEFLFTRTFEFESPLTPEELADELMTLRERGSRSIFAFMAVSRTVAVQYEGQGAYHFDIRHKRRQGQIAYTMAKAVGTFTAENGRAIIQGEVKFGAFYHTMLLLFALLMIGTVFIFAPFGLPAVSFFWFQIALIVGFLLFSWWHMYQDREALMALLSETLTTEKRKRAEARLSDDTPLDYSDAAKPDAESIQQAQSRKRF
jgi:hypothetical protein